MSNDDFEVLPRGTIEELRVLRQFVRDVDGITALSKSENLRNDLKIIIDELYLRYKSRIDESPV